MSKASTIPAREKRISSEIRLRISLKQGRDGYVVAECLDIPGCISQGKTNEEALVNIEDVVKTCLALIVREWITKAKTSSHQDPDTLMPVQHEAVRFTVVREEIA